MKPVIAIPQTRNNLYMKNKYAQSLEKAGAEVMWIELDNIANTVAESELHPNCYTVLYTI